LSIAGDYHVGTQNTPAIFPAFPFAADVPGKTEIDILGIAASESCDFNTANNYSQTKYLKLTREREILFDEDRNGLLFYQPIPPDRVVGVQFAEGVSLIGNFSAFDRREPFIPPTPLSFVSGELLRAEITVGEGSAGAGSIGQEYGEVAFIQRVRKV